MMTKNPSNEREQLEMLTIDQLVPNNHLVRKLEAAIDFSFIYSFSRNSSIHLMGVLVLILLFSLK
ncbi:Transposase, IS4 [Lysinibacillus sphaericus C3-41]|uniref:Transposase, IS4 n=1 Tax=Lysinibacillus sphaericus (strain C3-41) TaxID=444177 RepID=B1HUH2_LYSSC|nr:Transposase, IS4 [Lysinibacillus sphaericus C3-41]